MNNFNFSYFTRLFCCHPSQFETSELLCSSLISKYISHRQNAQQYFPASSNIELGSTYYPSRPTNSAPYYYGDLIYQQQQRQQSNLSSNQEASRVYAIMDGLRVQLKNPGRNNQSLRSPCVHRSDEFTVSLRGWLYRLEGAALKQWKRRWCVLADYCLFYYKDMAEEKLLGSLLLPSYRISPCFSRDGISRKFAFKAEHSNMKTYYFAADSKEMQQQWMNALSLASIMQLNIMCPTKTSKPTNNANFNSPNHHVDNIQHLNNNSQFLESKNSPKVTKDLTEDESGFLEYQAKRLEDNSAIMYGSDYYNSNFTGESLNLFNSVGLPSVFSDQMLPYNNYASAPPKPQRQYYAPTMSYDMPSSSLIDYNSPDLINANPNYYTDNYGPYYPDNNFSSSYPEYIEDSEFQHYPSNYYQRLPPRPHSADFLERNQDDDFDEECQNAFQKDDKNLFITNANLAPKILPSRPKSSIARYDPMLKSQNNKHSRTGFYNNSKPFDKKDFLSKLDNGLYDKPLTAYPNANHNLSQYFVYSNNGNYNYLLKNSTKEENEMNSQILSNYCKSENISNHSVPVRPPLPHEYASKFGTQNTDLDSNLSRSISSSCKILAKSDSTGKETSYTSDDENSLHEFNLKNSRKRKVKRKSKEDFNNVSDSEIHRKENRKTRSFKYSKRLCFSAADYVGKSNEELILMLIKLRRRQSDLSKSCDKLRLQMESEAKMMEIEPHRKEEYNFRFKELKQKLAKVEKEYEFRLPVIDTIDNMIKVKSNSRNNKAASTSLLDEVTSLDSRLNAVINLSEKIPDGFDKELDTNTTKMISSADNVETSNENIENLKKQQKVLANELDRVRGLLTHSTKKLEEKAVENAQMEHEMLIARNKLKQVLETEQEAMEITRSSKLESELAHINDVIDNLHSRRKELNTAIENLKNSDTKCTDSFIRPDISFIDDMVSLPDINRITLEQIDNRENDTSYQEVLLSSEEVPLYENITSARRFVDDNSLPSRSISMFDQVNNNLDNPENDEFFTLNINLNKTKQYSSKYGQEKNSTLEINNNDSKHNMNTMCEFDPTKDIHIAYGDSIVDQQIKQIYNYQPGGQKASEIKTVREVKRESERRKYHQQQNYKLSQFSRNDRAISNCGSYYLLSNHFYNENDSLAMHMPVTTSFIPENVSEFDDVLHIYNANALVTNPIQTKMTSLTEMTNDEINRNNFTTPDIVQSTIKLSDDFYDRED